MEVGGLAASPGTLAHRIRYALAQLRARNGYHTFEDICREFSRAKISRNILPATGPVGGGGDQGRDFETFRSFIQDEIDHVFSAIEPDGRIVFMCTLQQERLAEKIRADLAAIMKGGPVVVVYAFCEANVPVSQRHALQEWAKSAYQVELEIIDGNGLAELLATQELLPIAVDHLHFPSSLMYVYPEQSRPCQLPPGAADFTGRALELSELTALGELNLGVEPNVADSRVVVVSGPPGVGKSALVIRLARNLARKYADGQLYYDLRGVDQRPQVPNVVLGQFIRALGVERGDMSDDTAELAGIYRTLLANRKVLVVLDNAANEAQVRPLLAGGANCLVLVTSRTPLHALEGARTYRLGVLEMDESLALLAGLAGEDKVVDSSGCREIIQHCGGLPLAIRIAAGRLRARADWTPTDMAQRLADTHRRLDQLRLGDLDVRASFELSYRDLDSESRRLFCRLSTSPGSTFSAKLAGALLGTSEQNADDVLDRLVLDQLVTPTAMPDYYQMHDLLKLFASERLQDAGEVYNEYFSIVLDWYTEGLVYAAPHVTRMRSRTWSESVELEKLAPDDGLVAMAWMDAEFDNLRSILNAGNDSNNMNADRYIAVAALPIGQYAYQRGLWTEWAALIEMGLSAARRLKDRSRQAFFLFEFGDVYASQTAWAQAIKCWTDAGELIDSASFPEFCAMLHNRLAHIHMYAGNLVDAEREMAVAYEVFNTLDPVLANVAKASFYSELLMGKGQPERASEMVESNALPVIERISLHGQVELRTTLASAYTAQQRYPEALRQLMHCRKLCEKTGLRTMAPTVLLLLGDAYRRLRLIGRARKVWQEGLNLARRDVYPEVAGQLAMELGNIAFEDDEMARASELFAQAADAFRTSDLRCQLANALHNLASIRWHTGDRDGAESAWRQAVEALEDADDQVNARLTKEAIESARSKLIG